MCRPSGYELGYDKIANKTGENFTTTQYNGNIVGMVWKSSGDGIRRKYDYKYDAANRLLKATFEQNNDGTTVWDKNVIDYSVVMGDGDIATTAYDNNGNIKRMQQWGLKITSSPLIDDMTYSYFPNSNKLMAVTEGTTGTIDHKLGDFTDKNTTTTDYGYDKNGNLITDLNKKLVGTTGIDITTAGPITYNYLNLPQVITAKKDDGINAKGTITYTYDAAGNKLRKTTSDVSVTGKTITTITTYIGPFVYESKTIAPADVANPNYTDVLQFVSHEEGRIRRNATGSLEYDYFIKDHLGNVRMVLTEEQPTIYYPAATLEGTYGGTTNSMINYEKGFYNIDNTKVVAETAIPSWVSPAETVANTKLYYNNNGNPPANLSYPAGCTPVQTAGSGKVYKLNASVNKTGLEFVIKVMAGDVIDIFGKSYYLNTAAVTNTNSTALNLSGLMTNLLTSPGNPISAKGALGADLTTLNTGLIPSTFFRGSNSESATTVPKAYINYIFLDDQFKYAGGGASRVGISSSVKDHWFADAQMQNISAPKNGYIFVYLSNESNLDVFFDNLQVVHKPGPMLEETHYYPFGLTMSGISSKSAGSLINKKGFNGNELQNKEFSDGSGLEMYDFNARTYDQQIGRFIQIDPMLEEGGQETLSPYHFSYNNPIRFSDADGKEPDDIVVRGKNNSSVTIKTDLIDIDVNASSLGVDFGGSYTLEGDDILQVGLDIVGVFDPTGVADGLNAKLSADKGNWGDAIISSLGVVPYVGDLAKVGKIGKDIKIIETAIDGVKSARTSKAARREAMRDAGIPTSQPLIPDKATKSKDKAFTTRDKNHTVQNAKNNRSHKGKPHWEAGRTKKDPSKSDGLNRSGNNNKPQMRKPKSKVYYNE